MTEKDRLDQENNFWEFMLRKIQSQILLPFLQASLPKISEIINREDNLTVKFVGVVTRFKTIRTKKIIRPWLLSLLAMELGKLRG